MAELIIKHFPDFVKTINELQRYSVRGKIDSGILFTLSEANNKELVSTLKEKRFNDMRKWVIANIDKEQRLCFVMSMKYYIRTANDPKSIPQSLLSQVISTRRFVADQKKSIWSLSN